MFNTIWCKRYNLKCLDLSGEKVRNDMFQLQFTFFAPLIWGIVVRERTRIVVRLRKKFFFCIKQVYGHIQQNVN